VHIDEFINILETLELVVKFLKMMLRLQRNVHIIFAGDIFSERMLR
jgi:hypothetical protein